MAGGGAEADFTVAAYRTRRVLSVLLIFLLLVGICTLNVFILTSVQGGDGVRRFVFFREFPLL